MKKVFHSIISVAIALLLVVSTISWSVEKHYCMGHLMDIALFSEPDSCGMGAGMAENTGEDKSSSSCCNDEVLVLGGQDDLQISFDDLSFENQQFLVAFTYSYNNLNSFGERKTSPRDTYPPPLLVKNIQLLDQVFII